MVTHMKTTIEIADDIFFRAKETSQETGITFKELVSEGLVYVLEKRKNLVTPQIKPITFKGSGLSPEFSDAPWSAFREALYEGRGS